MKTRLENLIVKIIVLLFALLPILVNPFGSEIFALPRVWFLYISTSLVVFLFIHSIFIKKDQSIKYTNLHVILLILLIIISLSTIFSQNKIISFYGFSHTHEGLLTWTCYFILFYFGCEYFTSRSKFNVIAKIITLQVILISLLSIINYFFGVTLINWTKVSALSHANSLLKHPSYLGSYILLFWPFTIYTYKNNLFENNFIPSFSILLGFVTLILSFSRGSWIAFLITLIIFLIFFSKNIIHYIKNNFTSFCTLCSIIFLTIILTTVLNYNFTSSIVYHFKSINDHNTASIQVRNLLYYQSLSLLKENWLKGIGPDNYSMSITQHFLPQWEIYNEKITHKAHNFILDSWINFGISGLIILISIIFSIFFLSFKLLKNNLKENDLLAFILFSLISYFISIQFFYFTIDVTPFFWFLLGIACGILIKNNIIRIKTFNIEHLLKEDYVLMKYSLLSLSFASLILISYTASQKIQADILFKRSLNDNELSISISLLEKAINKNSLIPDYYLNLSHLQKQYGEFTGIEDFIDKALQTMKNGTQKIPNDYKLFIALGETYYNRIHDDEGKNNYLEKAHRALLTAKKLYPNNSKNYYLLGEIYRLREDNENAIRHWQKCLLLNNNNTQCLYSMYKIHKQKNDYKIADEFYKKYITLIKN